MLESATYAFRTGVINLDTSLEIQASHFDNVKTKRGISLELIEKTQATSTYVKNFFILYLIIPDKPNIESILDSWFDLLSENSVVFLVAQNSNSVEMISKKLPKNMSICQSSNVNSWLSTIATGIAEKQVSFVEHHFLMLCGSIENAGSTRLFPNDVINFHSTCSEHHVFVIQENNHDDLITSTKAMLSNLDITETVSGLIVFIDFPESSALLEFTTLQKCIFECDFFKEYDDLFWVTPWLYRKDNIYRVTLFIAT